MVSYQNKEVAVIERLKASSETVAKIGWASIVLPFLLPVGFALAIIRFAQSKGVSGVVMTDEGLRRVSDLRFGFLWSAGVYAKIMFVVACYWLS